MKKQFIILILCAVTSSLCYSQEKWRNLNFTSVSGISLKGEYFSQISSNLSYELNNNYFISNWNGFNYNYVKKQGWFASQTTIDKKLKQFVVGAGYQYNYGLIYNNAPDINLKDNSFLIVKCQYNIKL